MTRKIITVCKYNQARSITAAAALRRFFPEEEIISAGILAQPTIQIPSSILHILDEWKLYERDQKSMSAMDLPQLNPEDIILCADEEVRTKFRQQLKLDDLDYKNVFILEEFSSNLLDIPIDPVSLGASETKTQLARALILSIRAVRKILDKGELIGTSYLPNTRDEHIAIQDYYLGSTKKNTLLIDTGFSIPNPNIWSARFVQKTFNPLQFPDVSEMDFSSKVLCTKYEMDNTAEIFLSKNYYNWILELSRKYRIEVISQPFHDLPLSRQHESILGTIHS